MPKIKLTSKEKDNLIKTLIINIDEKDRVIKQMISNFVDQDMKYSSREIEDELSIFSAERDELFLGFV